MMGHFKDAVYFFGPNYVELTILTDNCTGQNNTKITI